MSESEKDLEMKPRAPLPWVRELDDTTSSPMRRCRLIRSADGPVVAYDVGGIPEADYIVHACNSHPKLLELAAEKDVEIARLRERVALLDSLLGECLRHHYYDEARVSQSWLAEARKAIETSHLSIKSH